MTATAKLLKKKIITGDVVTDLFCGGLHGQTDCRRRQNSSVNKRVMSRTKNPEHMAFVMFHNPMRSHSGMFRFVCNVNHSIFAATCRLTSPRQIRVFFVKARRHSIASVFRPTVSIVLFHCFGIHIFETIRLPLPRLQNTFVRTIFANRTAVFGTNKFFLANAAFNRRIFPIRQ